MNCVLQTVVQSILDSYLKEFNLDVSQDRYRFLLRRSLCRAEIAVHAAILESIRLFYRRPAR